jgi:hypothetical protein
MPIDWSGRLRVDRVAAGRTFMRKMALVLLSAVVLGVAASPAHAITYEDSFEQCNYPKTFDLAVMRPVSLITILAGTVMFVPLAPLALITVPGEIGTIYHNLIGAPVGFTFDRALGECKSVDLSY